MEALRAALSTSATTSGPVQDLLQHLTEVKLDVQIASVGGVGTDLLMRFLNEHGISTNLVTDFDSLKHPFKPLEFTSGSEPHACIYLFGNPLDSIASHYRRGWAERQASKTSGGTVFSDFPQTFEQYIARGEDLFGYEPTLKHWLTDIVAYDILLVRYEHLFDHVPELLDFICKKTSPLGDLQAMVADFPAKRERKSRVSDAQKASLYVDLQQRIESLPHCFVRKAGQAVHL